MTLSYPTALTGTSQLQQKVLWLAVMNKTATMELSSQIQFIARY